MNLRLRQPASHAEVLCSARVRNTSVSPFTNHIGEMKHNPNARRGRNRGNGKRYVPLRNQTFESNGPDGKIRGTAQQVLERYLALGRDASSSGDPVAAESYYQHAEHYFRLLHAAEAAEAERAAERIRRFGTSAGDGQGDDGSLDGPPDDRPEEGTEELTY